MWGLDAETVIQILFVVFVVGGAVVQAIWRGYQKTVAEAERRRAEGGKGGKDPSEALRDLLAELRGEGRRGREGGPEEPSSAEVEPVESGLYGEEPEPRTRVEEPPEVIEVLVEEEVPPPVPRPSVGGRGVGRPGLPASIPEGERLKFAESQIASQLDEHVRATLASSLSAQMESAEVAKPERNRRRLPGGVTLRDAIIAQVVLGPPPGLGPRRGGGAAMAPGLGHFGRRRRRRA